MLSPEKGTGISLFSMAHSLFSISKAIPKVKNCPKLKKSKKSQCISNVRRPKAEDGSIKRKSLDQKSYGTYTSK